MSKSELLAKLKLVRAQTDATVELLNNSAALPFSLDDEYEADYLIGCLESNSQKLYALANKCRSATKSGQQEQSVETEEPERLMLASATSSSRDDICMNQSANESAVNAADADSDETASLDSSHASTPLCGGNVSSDQISYSRSVRHLLHHLSIHSAVLLHFCNSCCSLFCINFILLLILMLFRVRIHNKDTFEH